MPYLRNDHADQTECPERPEELFAETSAHKVCGIGGTFEPTSNFQRRCLVIIRDIRARRSAVSLAWSWRYSLTGPAKSIPVYLSLFCLLKIFRPSWANLHMGASNVQQSWFAAAADQANHFIKVLVGGNRSSSALHRGQKPMHVV
ncbi:hypothetical protein B0H17DRAFT_1135952 [Mycena rosella]|uniref:Uncharacterized protein n=1 Tax=Mycena rosella TaxID=1033263 RepID=A0AAD7GH99_MYCRO|nr:hypothetical protein B0H17DRAFT_1135952 [Mycena rosella]